MRTKYTLPDAEMAEKSAQKVARSALRLRYSVKADQELNKLLPAMQRRIHRAMNDGKSWELDYGAIFRGEAVEKMVVIEGDS